MAVSSCDVKAVVRNQCFFMDFEGDAEYRKITYSLIHSSIYDEHDSANFESVHHSICKLHPFK